HAPDPVAHLECEADLKILVAASLGDFASGAYKGIRSLVDVEVDEECRLLKLIMVYLELGTAGVRPKLAADLVAVFVDHLLRALLLRGAVLAFVHREVGEQLRAGLLKEEWVLLDEGARERDPALDGLGASDAGKLLEHQVVVRHGGRRR